MIRNIDRRKVKRVLIKAFYYLLIAIVLAGLTFSGYLIALSQNQIEIIIDENIKYQRFSGFGASSAWTFEEIGKLTEEHQNNVIDLLYSSKGLNLNVYRYNIGAGSKESIFDDQEPYTDKNFDESRRAESFFDSALFEGDYKIFSSPDNYDFEKDGASVSMLKKAVSEGKIKKIVFFANSPHYLMTHSGKAIGEYEYQNNLKNECFEAFSDYLLIIANNLFSEVSASLPLDAEIVISPVNEPQWKWGGKGSSQEGCHYDSDILAGFYQYFYTKLVIFNQENGTSFKMDVFESGNYIMEDGEKSNVKEYIQEFKRYEFYSHLSELSFHSYGTNTNLPKRTEFYDYAKESLVGKDIIMSEYCHMESGPSKNISTGLYTGQVMLRDLTHINASEWNWWLGVSDLPFEDGLVYWDHQEEGSQNTFFLTKRYYVFGHFSRYIPTNSVRIDSTIKDPLGTANTDIVAFLTSGGEIVLVIINKSLVTQKAVMDLPFTTVTAVTTNNKVDWETQQIEYNGEISYPGMSITTLIFSN